MSNEKNQFMYDFIHNESNPDSHKIFISGQFQEVTITFTGGPLISKTQLTKFVEDARKEQCKKLGVCPCCLEKHVVEEN